MSDPEAEMRSLVVESLHRAVELAESGMSITDPIREEIMRRGNLTRIQFDNQLVQHVRVVDKIRESVENGSRSLDSAFEIAATGTGILLHMQSVMHSLEMARQGGQDLAESRRRLVVLNRTRIRFIGGTETDQISNAVNDLTRAQPRT